MSSQGTAKDDPMDDADDNNVHVKGHVEKKNNGIAAQNVRLTELFDGHDSDDEEFPSSAPIKQQPSSPPARIASPM